MPIITEQLIREIVREEIGAILSQHRFATVDDVERIINIVNSEAEAEAPVIKGSTATVFEYRRHI